MENSLECVVEEGHIGLRADKFLALMCPDISRARLQALMAQGHVQMNGAPFSSASLKTSLGDVFAVFIPPSQTSKMLAEDIPLDIVYEDDDLLVINKHVGMVVHPGAGNWSGTLVNALLHHCGDSLSGIGGVERPGIVHRLDKDTSGLMVVAKNDLAHQGLSAQLADRTLTRIYHTLVVGVPVPLKGVVDRPIGRHRTQRIKMSITSNAMREARTHYRVLKDFAGAMSLLECRLETGRTHQIRVHMETIGHNVIGDPLYGAQPTKLKSLIKKAGYSTDIEDSFISVSGQMLHAKEIAFIHPRLGEEVRFSSEYPERFDKVLKLIDK